MKNKKIIAIVTAIIAVVALFTGLLVACNNNKALTSVTNADSSGYVVANYGKGYSLYNKKNKQVIKEFYNYMEIAKEGYLLASNDSDKGMSLLDYSGKVLISGVNSDFQSYDFEMNYEGIADNSNTNAMGEPTTLKSLKSSVAYITATDSENVDTIFSPSGAQIVRLEDTEDTEYYFEPNILTNVVMDNNTTTTTEKHASFAVVKINNYKETQTKDEYSEEKLTVYDSNFKEIYNRTSQSMSFDVIEDGVNFAYTVEYKNSDDYKLDIVSQDGSVKTFKDSEVTLARNANLLAIKESGTTNTKINNILTGKTLTVNGTVNRMYKIDNDFAEIIFSDYSTQIIDKNSMSLKLSLDSSLTKENSYFYSTADAVYDTNFNKIEGVTGFVNISVGKDYSLLKKTNDTYILYKHTDKVAEVPSSIARDSSTGLITYTDASGVKQYVHISAPNKPLYSENNKPTSTGIGGGVNWFIHGDNLYLYDIDSIYTMYIGSKISSYSINLNVILYGGTEQQPYIVTSLKLSAKDDKISDQYKLILITLDSIKEIASGESKFTISQSYDTITIKNDEQYLHGDISMVDGDIDFKLKDYSNVKNISYIADKYVVTTNPNTNLNAVYLDGKMILPALYKIEEIQYDYVVYKDNFNKNLSGLIKLEKDGYKVVEKAKYDSIDILNKDYIEFTETKNGEPSISIKNMTKNKFVFKNVYSVMYLSAPNPSSMIVGETYSLTIACTEKKGGNTKLVRVDMVIESIY